MSYRGLALKNNLSEPLQDRQSLNNLSFVGADQDLEIFINNTQNVSSLEWSLDGIDSDVIESSSGIDNRRLLFGRDVPFVYTTNDKVQIEVRDTQTGNVIGTDLDLNDTNSVYYVTDFEIGLGFFSNQKAFGLASEPDGVTLDLSSVADKYITFIRDDFVSPTNFLNIATPEIINSDEAFGDVVTDSPIGFFDYDEIGNTFNDGFNRLENNITASNFKRRVKYAQNKTVGTDLTVNIQGLLTIDDPADELSLESDLENEKAPGIYITDPFSDVNDIQRTRAFSTASNPWEETADTLITQSSQVNIGDLKLDDGIVVDDIQFSSVTSSFVLNDFTHKLPVTLNGVEYYLILSEV